MRTNGPLRGAHSLLRRTRRGVLDDAKCIAFGLGMARTSGSTGDGPREPLGFAFLSSPGMYRQERKMPLVCLDCCALERAIECVSFQGQCGENRFRPQSNGAGRWRTRFFDFLK